MMGHNKRKTIPAILSLLVLLIGSALGSLAYLTSEDTVTNTFTVGKVSISLDEAKVGDDGIALTDTSAVRVKENTYNSLMPGMTYDKDPTVHVLKGSEDCYVRVFVTVTEANDLKQIFTDRQIPNLDAIFTGHDSTKWDRESITEDTDADTMTYEYRLKDKVTKNADANQDFILFTNVKIPEAFEPEDFEKLPDGIEIKIRAEAVQAASFDDADAAWNAAFPATTSTPTTNP